MKGLVLGVGLGVALALAGCAGNPNPDVASANQVVIAVNAYNTAVATGTNYLRLPICNVSAPPCRTQEMSQTVYNALRSGRVARNQLVAGLKANSAASLTALQALSAAYSVIQNLPH